MPSKRKPVIRQFMPLERDIMVWLYRWQYAPPERRSAPNGKTFWRPCSVDAVPVAFFELAFRTLPKWDIDNALSALRDLEMIREFWLADLPPDSDDGPPGPDPMSFLGTWRISGWPHTLSVTASRRPGREQKPYVLWQDDLSLAWYCLTKKGLLCAHDMFVEAMAAQRNKSGAISLPKGLNEAERTILEAIGNQRLTGQQVADKAGYPLNSSFKAILSGLRRRGILDNIHDSVGRGYQRSDLGPDQLPD